MEARTSIADSLRILRHFPVEKLVCTAVWIVNRIKTAGTDAAAAAFAFIIVNDCFFIYIRNRIASAFFCTAAAATTDFRIDCRFSACMLLHFSCTASASHTDIFNGSAKSGCLMSLKMAQADKNVRIHDRMSDQSRFAVFSVYNRNFYFIRSSQAISDDNLTSGRSCIKTIEICTVQMFQCILSASRIQCITVCQKRHSALLLAQICNYLCIIWSKKSHISKFTKMHLDRHKLSIHINVFDAGSNTKFFQLVQLAGPYRTAKIGKINSRFSHVSSS